MKPLALDFEEDGVGAGGGLGGDTNPLDLLRERRVLRPRNALAREQMYFSTVASTTPDPVGSARSMAPPTPTSGPGSQ